MTRVDFTVMIAANNEYVFAKTICPPIPTLETAT